jgi:hypothetical protein
MGQWHEADAVEMAERTDPTALGLGRKREHRPLLATMDEPLDLNSPRRIVAIGIPKLGERNAKLGGPAE